MNQNSCLNCIHQRRRDVPELRLGAVNAETLKVRSEWNTEWKRREQDEYHRFCAGEPFFEKPFFYRWCSVLTPPASPENELGDIGGLIEYVLCARQNPDADCLSHSASQSGHYIKEQ